MIKKLRIEIIEKDNKYIKNIKSSSIDKVAKVRWNTSRTTSGLSGISTGSNIMNLATFVVAGLAMAVTVQISKYIGMKNEERIGRLLGATIALFSIISVVVSVVLIVFAPQLSVLMQDVDAVFSWFQR